MTTYAKPYTLDFSSTGDDYYDGFDKLEDDIDYLITSLNANHMSARGDMIYKGASGAAALAVGTVGKFIRSNGTDPAYSPLLTVQNVTATANLTNGANWAILDPGAATVLTIPDAASTYAAAGNLLIIQSYSSAYKASFTTTTGTDNFYSKGITIGTSVTMLGPGHTIVLAPSGSESWIIIDEYCPPLVNVTPVTTAAVTTEQNLQTISIFGGALRAGDVLRIASRMTGTGTANTRTGKIYFGSQALQSEAKTAGNAWTLTGFLKEVTVEAAAVQYNTEYAMTENTANTVTVKTTGDTDDAADDLISQSLIVSVLRG